MADAFIFMAKPGRALSSPNFISWSKLKCKTSHIFGMGEWRKGEQQERRATLYKNSKMKKTLILLYQHIHLIAYSTPHCQLLSSVCDGVWWEQMLFALSLPFTFKSAELLLDSSCLVCPFEPSHPATGSHLRKTRFVAQIDATWYALGPGTPLEIIQFKCKLFVFEITISIRTQTHTQIIINK